MPETKFGRDAVQTQDILPVGAPIGSADEQVAEAMRIAKENNRKLAAMENNSFGDVITRMENLGIQAAVTYCQELSDHERTRHLKAEQLGKNRKMILGSFGWE